MINTKAVKHSVILPIYRFLFARNFLYAINKAVFTLSLRGIGVLNNENTKISGEEWFIKKTANLLEDSFVMDIGANIGDYSTRIKKHAPKAKVYSFEPHPKTFRELKKQAEKDGYIPVNAGCGNKNKEDTLYDYEGLENTGSSHASMYEGVISQIHSNISAQWNVRIIKIDDFVRENNIDRIRLLKVDVEGAELEVLQGMSQTIKAGLVDLIQFEFNEMNIISRVFLKDIYMFLDNYEFYRLMPNGLMALGKYSPVHWEIFAYQNIVAINKSFTFNWRCCTNKGYGRVTATVSFK